MITAEQLQELAVDIDVRLADVWVTILGCNAILGGALDDDDAREAFASLLRVAYGRGYLDALNEDAEGKRGALTTAHGYVTP